MHEVWETLGEPVLRPTALSSSYARTVRLAWRNTDEWIMTRKLLIFYYTNARNPEPSSAELER